MARFMAHFSVTTWLSAHLRTLTRHISEPLKAYNFHQCHGLNDLNPPQLNLWSHEMPNPHDISTSGLYRP